MIVPSADSRVPEADIAQVIEVLRGGVLTNGPVVPELEREFSAFVGSNVETVAVSSGTAALALAADALGLCRNSRVLVPGLTFAATANAFLSRGCEVVPIDVDATTMNLSPHDLAYALTEAPADAVVIVDLFGSTRGTDEAVEVARNAGVRVIEDAAQAHGARVGSGDRVGARGDVTTFSLYATKNMSAGEGGLITTSDAEVGRCLRRLRSHGSLSEYVHEVHALNFRLTEVQAVLARGALQRLEDGNRRRRIIASRYGDIVQEAWRGASSPSLKKFEDHVFHQFTVRLPTMGRRNELIAALREKGIAARHFYPYTVRELPGVTERATPVAERLRDSVLSIPIFPTLTDEQVHAVEHAIRSLARTSRE